MKNKGDTMTAVAVLLAVSAFVGLVLLLVLLATVAVVLVALVAGVVALVKHFRKEEVQPVMPEWEPLATRREIVETLDRSIQGDFRTGVVKLPPPRSYSHRGH